MAAGSPRLVHAVVIPTFGRPQAVQRLLDALDGQTARPDRVVIVDDTPGNEVEALARPGDIYHRMTGRPSLTRARNAARRYVDDADLVTYFDSDVLPAPDYLEEIQALAARRPDASGWMGHVPDFPQSSAWRNVATAWMLMSHVTRNTCRLRWPLHVSYPNHPQGDLPSDWVYGCNMTFPGSVVQAHAFEDQMERYCYGEDLDFSIRVSRATGQGFWLTPMARLEHQRGDEGRIPPVDLLRMRQVHRTLLTVRECGDGPIIRAKLAWAAKSNVILYGRLEPARGREYEEARKEVTAALEAQWDDVLACRFAAFNHLYSFLV